MSAVVTSFAGLCGALGVSGVRIPIIQRDYAQGRADASQIRKDFVARLRDALVHGKTLGLDFIYGSREDGAFVPIDGQQRLTTLFLLHWYLGARAGTLDAAPWLRLSYETRPSARAFCEALVARRTVDVLDDSVARWIKDQPWFLSAWRHDPTVAGMLTMLDEIDAQLRGDDHAAAWAQLTRPDAPAVTFHVLSVEGAGSAERLYLTMNARGKALTEFENFKAVFEQILSEVDAKTGATVEKRVAARFSRSVDNAWSDLLWPMRASSDAGDRPADRIIDDEFMRYFKFVTRICEWLDGKGADGSLLERAEAVYGPENDAATANIERLFAAFDVWCTAPPSDFFAAHFSLRSHETGKVSLFVRDPNLFRACCARYGEGTEKQPAFPLGQVLLLHAVLTHAVLTHRAASTPDFARRVRVLRNLIEASDIRDENMPRLLSAVAAFVKGPDEDLDGLDDFSSRQLAEERTKATIRAATPHLASVLDELEDHRLLRGCLAAFDLGATGLPSLAARAKTFHELFVDADEPLIGVALLAHGSYEKRDRGRFQLVAMSNDPDDPWADLFRRSTEERFDRARPALMSLLDDVATRSGDRRARLGASIDAWCATRESARGLDWRYYVVGYPAMRATRYGNYARQGTSGSTYVLYMLWQSQFNGRHWDPYLLAVYREQLATHGDAARVSEPVTIRQSETRAEVLRLARSAIEIRSAPDGFALTVPSPSPAITDILNRHGVVADRLQILQRDGIDTEDRVARCAALVRDLVAAGL